MWNSLSMLSSHCKYAYPKDKVHAMNNERDVCLGEMKKDKSVERGCSSCCSVL